MLLRVICGGNKPEHVIAHHTKKRRFLIGAALFYSQQIVLNALAAELAFDMARIESTPF